MNLAYITVTKGTYARTLIVPQSNGQVMLDIDKDGKVLGVEVLNYTHARIGNNEISHEKET